ncbi:CoA pyrophosphatase [Salinisphaera sp.]|uniref:NUDIX hydrolase n=1 Tax=Salinisphaera sp. TaxID=1914330 RepID=UPI002D79C9E2|nr:CoA pyrophosphatase [Salinisphaera sp.]HET7314152.1 CoA pyrophosphatase [Salinisphaera sp.]
MHELAPLVIRLEQHRPRRNPLRRRLKRAAVAALLRDSRQGAEVLVIERAHRPGDPWSGDLALPGGRIEAGDDASASRAACRETGEEIGIAIDRSLGLGRLSDRLTLDHRRRRPMVISPFVYRWPLGARITPNEEIAGWQWIALAWLDEPANRGRLTWRLQGLAQCLAKSMPCYDCGDGRRLWGLTLSMLDELRRIGNGAGR